MYYSYVEDPLLLCVGVVLQSAGGDVSASIADEVQHEEGSSTAERMHMLFQQMSKLEDNVRVHRTLLEAEEQLLYVDVVAQLQRVYQNLLQQRADQGFTLTPWVRIQQLQCRKIYTCRVASARPNSAGICRS